MRWNFCKVRCRRRSLIALSYLARHHGMTRMLVVEVNYWARLRGRKAVATAQKDSV